MSDEVLHEQFLGEYLRYPSVSVPKLFAEWARRDPKHFGAIKDSLPGVRTLRQDPWECAICFILSSNNNIKRITSLVQTLRREFGSPIAGLENQWAFPSLDQLRPVKEATYRDLGMGYRAKYLVDSVAFIQKQGGVKWLEGLRDLKEGPKVREELI